MDINHFSTRVHSCTHLLFSGSLTLSLRAGPAAQHLKPETFLVVPHPAETGGDHHSHEPGSHQVGEGVGADCVYLVFLIVQVESCLLLPTALGPSVAVLRHGHSQTDVADVGGREEVCGGALGS